MKQIIGKLLMALIIAAGVLTIAAPQTRAAGITVYKDGDKYVKLGGRIQLQYHLVDPDSGDSSDSLFFRRFRPYIEGSLHKDWKGKFQWDMGKASGDNEIAIKDAYLQYKGVENIKVTVGNANFPFSRELLTSSKKQQLVERTFVGDHDYGIPDRNLGVNIGGHVADKKITYQVAFASASIDPDAKKLDFDTPVNKNSDFNEGWMVGGRVDYHPFGLLKFSQGDFKGETKAAIGVAAFSWNNDDDNNTSFCDGADRKSCDSTKTDYTKPSGKPDVESITGFEVSGALRLKGFSVDAEYNLFDAETVDPAITSGIYKNGKTELTNYAIEGGYMVIPDRLELVAGYQAQDADNYATEWTRTSLGANWFFKKHDIKTQVTYRMGENLEGQYGNDEDELFFQVQYVF